mmetsp:Transcript_9592/g.14376  ORF Transcript_9592/g.14376 Transcript_9592/m.14376 type:complete len:486 (+) Transcript_9592:52-1509(+)
MLRALHRIRPLQRIRRTAFTRSFQKIVAPPMVYISGEEMTRYTMELILDKWIKPRLDISQWEFYDLSCKSRDDTEDQVLKDAVEAGKRICSIFKEPSVTPTEIQKEKLGLKKAWGSPNGAMRRGWNGITISRDTIHIEGMELGYNRPVLFERHAVGGEYGAGWAQVGSGNLVTTFTTDDGESMVVDERKLSGDTNMVVTYHNPLDNVSDLAHHFFSRCLAADITPFVVTKKTVFKWQEEFWVVMKKVFDEHYREAFIKKGLVTDELQHLISDAATMQIIRWTDGGFGMAAHNYDGDMLTDEIAQVHRSPGFITSNLLGKREDGIMIKEYEASHGTVADMWDDHLAGKETSLNPLGMVEALIGAINHSAHLSDTPYENQINLFTGTLRSVIHSKMVNGEGTRDLCGPSGLTTEQFVDTVSEALDASLPIIASEKKQAVFEDVSKVDMDALQAMFNDLDTDGNGSISFDEFSKGLRRLGVQPRKLGF